MYGSLRTLVLLALCRVYCLTNRTISSVASKPHDLFYCCCENHDVFYMWKQHQEVIICQWAIETYTDCPKVSPLFLAEKVSKKNISDYKKVLLCCSKQISFFLFKILIKYQFFISLQNPSASESQWTRKLVNYIVWILFLFILSWWL